MQEEKQEAIRIWDVIFTEDAKGYNIMELNDLNLYRIVDDGVVELSSGYKHDGVVLFYNVSNTTDEFKEKYKDIIVEYTVMNVLSEKKVNSVKNGAKHLFEMINADHRIPELSAFRIFQKELNNGKLVLRENPGHGNDLSRLYYDVSDTNDEFKEKYKDIIENVEVDADNVIYITDPKFTEEIKGKSL